MPALDVSTGIKLKGRLKKGTCLRKKGMRGWRRDALRLSGMWLMLQRNNDCDQLSKGLLALKGEEFGKKGRLHSSLTEIPY